MYIHEAVQAALSKEGRAPFIKRKSWPYNRMAQNGYKVRPTNAPGGCVVYSLDFPAERWIPSAADLVADDWETCL